MILCGGFGTRLREKTEYRPKPMVKFAKNPSYGILPALKDWRALTVRVCEI